MPLCNFSVLHNLDNNQKYILKNLMKLVNLILFYADTF